jgi:isocitrate dehydrogenase (NAD+)
MPPPVTIVRIAGDGVGPELLAAASRVVEATGLPVRWVDAQAGLAAFPSSGTTAPPETLELVRRHRYAIKGPVETPNGGVIRSANYYIRRELVLYACLRPLPIIPSRPLLLVRENVEDLYGADERMADPDTALATKVATRAGCERIVEYAFALAEREHRDKVTLVHKANNLKLTEGMFLEVGQQVAARHRGTAFEEMLADTAFSVMVTDPARFDVLVTSNTIGDLLSNLGAALAGSIGLVGSLNSGDGIHVAEAGHGHAGELAGRDLANPTALFEGVRLLLVELGRVAQAGALATALAELRRRGITTFDLGGTATTSEVTESVCDMVTRLVPAHAG